MHNNRQTPVEAIRDAITADGHTMFFKGHEGTSEVWECQSRRQRSGQPATVFTVWLTDEGWHVGAYSYRQFIVPKHADIIETCRALLDAENADVANIPEDVVRRLEFRETEYRPAYLPRRPH